MDRPWYDDDMEWLPYVRISDDREGAGIGVDGQLAELVPLGKRLGGRILEPLVDNDLTAYDRSERYRTRPGYDRLCELLLERPGRRGVLAWHTDRMHRTPRELEDFIDLIERTGAPVHTVKSGVIDLSHASGRMTARVHCAVARHESEHKSERVKRRIAEKAAGGEIGNGGTRPYGYRRIYAGEGRHRRIVRDEVDPREADVIRQIAHRLLAGDSVRSVLNWLNDQAGEPTSTGGRWSRQGLRQAMTSPRIAGFREHRGRVTGPAVWPAIIDRDTHEQLRALFAARATGQRPFTGRVHYLAGSVHCSSCLAAGRPSKMRPTSQNGGRLVMKCMADTGGCGGRVVGLEPLREMIDTYMVRRLSDGSLLRRLARAEAVDGDRTTELVQRIDADERRLALLQDSLADGDEGELPEVVATIRSVRKRIGAARAELAALAGLPRVAGSDLADLARRWRDPPAAGGLTVERKAALLRLLVAQIVVGPRLRHGPGFDPRRISLVPR